MNIFSGLLFLQGHVTNVALAQLFVLGLEKSGHASQVSAY